MNKWGALTPPNFQILFVSFASFFPKGQEINEPVVTGIWTLSFIRASFFSVVRFLFHFSSMVNLLKGFVLKACLFMFELYIRNTGVK